MDSAIARLFSAGTNMYAVAVMMFQEGDFWKAELMAASALGIATFLSEDKETPPQIKSLCERFVVEAKTLAEQARKEWVASQGSKLSGSSRKSKDDGDITDILRDIVRQSAE